MSTIGEQRINLIETAISEALTPDHLDVEDESHLHAGRFLIAANAAARTTLIAR